VTASSNRAASASTPGARHARSYRATQSFTAFRFVIASCSRWTGNDGRARRAPTQTHSMHRPPDLPFRHTQKAPARNWDASVRPEQASSDVLTPCPQASRTIGEAMRFNHIGIPTVDSFDGEIPLPHLKLTVSVI
jgi:hypothetical protein